MKKVFGLISSFIFNLLCNVFRCNYNHLDAAYVSTGELPASPRALRETLIYKRIKRFVKIATLFKNFDLVLDVYYYTPSSIGRCVWNVLRDETKYILFSKDDKFGGSTLILGKWMKDKFIELATIEEEAAEEDDYEDEVVILKSYYLENSYGYIQLVKYGGIYLVGWNAIESIDNDDWSYSVRRFNSFEKANAEYEERYEIDKGCGNTI